MKDNFISFILSGYSSLFEEVRQQRQAAKQAQEANTNDFKTMVSFEWLCLIEKEGMEAAKRFMQECRERQICPSSHLDLTDFLEAGKAAMKAHFRSQINSTIWK